MPETPPKERLRPAHGLFTEDEYALLNWCRFRCGPGAADWNSFVRSGMLAYARHIARTNAHKLPQGLAEVIERLKENETFKT